MILLALCVSAAPVAAESVEDRLMDLQLIPLDPDPAPGFTLAGLDGEKISLSDFRGRAVLLYFFATW